MKFGSLPDRSKVMKPVLMPRGPHGAVWLDPYRPESMKPSRSNSAIRWVAIGTGILVMVGAVVRGWL